MITSQTICVKCNNGELSCKQLQWEINHYYIFCVCLCVCVCVCVCVALLIQHEKRMRHIIQGLSKRFERFKFGIFYILIVKIRYNFTHK